MKKNLLLLLALFFFIQGKASDYIGCTKLKKIDLPECILIGDSAFIGCASLKELSFPYSQPPLYGKDAFLKPETISIGLAQQDDEIVKEWRKIPEWDAFIWKPNPVSIDDVDAPRWEMSLLGNNVIISGLIPGIEVRFVTISGVQYRFIPFEDGSIDVTLPSGFYIVNQKDKNEKIIITK